VDKSLKNKRKTELIGICYVLGSVCFSGFLMIIFCLINSKHFEWIDIFLIMLALIALFFTIGFFFVLPSRYRKQY